MAAIVDNPIELGATGVILVAFVALLYHVMREQKSLFKSVTDAINLNTATLQSLHMTVIQQEHHGLSEEVREERLNRRYEELHREMENLRARVYAQATGRDTKDSPDLMSTIVTNLTKKGA